MPTYQYVCRSCETPLEVVQTFTEPALTDCPNCDGGQLRKVFNSVGVVFKGSGFYRTDSRSGSDSAGKTGDKDSPKPDSKSEGMSQGKSDSDSSAAGKGSGSKSEGTGGGPAANTSKPSAAKSQPKAE